MILNQLEGKGDIALLALAQWACLEDNPDSYQEALNLLQRFERESLAVIPSWRAWIQLTKARIYHLMHDPEHAKQFYDQGVDTLANETLHIEAASRWFHMGEGWMFGHIARQEAEEAMGLPISPLKPAFPPTNHSN